MQGRTDAREEDATSDMAGGGRRATRASTARMAIRGRWAFARHWELWLALALASFLRLWHIELTQFLSDQAVLVGLARVSVLHAWLPVTSNGSSVGAYNSPLIEFLMMPFLLVSKDPLPAVISIALWNVLGVAVSYVFTLRFFGRRTAAIAALLFATSGVAINYSRFIWQPNYWAPVIAVWALSLYACVILGRRGWFVVNVAALALAALLHPVAAILAPVTILALLLAPRCPGKGGYALSALVLLVLLLPSILFEVLSHGADLRVYTRTFLNGQGRFGLSVLRSLYSLFGTPGNDALGPGSPRLTFALASGVLNVVAALLFVVGYVVITIAVVRPAVAIRRQGERRQGRWQSLGAYARGVWRGLRADAGWRGMLLLWLWVTLPPLSMLHYSLAAPPVVHYLLVMLPGAFVVAAIGAGWLLDRAARFAQQAVRPREYRAGRVMWAALLAALVLLISGQAVVSAFDPASLAAGTFEAYQFYGYPLAEVQAADARIGALQRQQGAAGIFVVEPAEARYAIALEYALVGEHPDRAGFAANCLVLPAAASGPALAVVTAPDTPAGALLATLPNSTLVSRIALAGGAPWPVYRITGQLPPLADEHAVAAATFINAAGEGLRLDAVAQPAPGLLRLRWDVLGYTLANAAQPALRISAQPASLAAPSAPASAGTTDCQPTRLQAGETLFTWVQLPTAANSASMVAISVRAGTIGADLLTLGPLRLLADRPAGTPLAPLVPSVAASAQPGRVSGATYVVPLP
jgi:hypothetical protein